MKILGLFLSLSFLSASGMTMKCSGTEPFWGATLGKDKITVEFAGEEEKEIITVDSIKGAAGYVDSFVRVFSSNKTPVAVVTSNSCNNGMSDHTYPNEVIIFTPTYNLYGCCGEGVLAE
ncbi:MAG: hypothetical protein H6620_07285 [Halobacteriovoraceae bacterium]|nr:hypothetical protein [Halobacteriovoraceae bacterium]